MNSSSMCVLTQSTLPLAPSLTPTPHSFNPVLATRNPPSSPQRANILKEVAIMQGLNHPSIVRLLNFTESREHYFLTLE